MSTENIQQAKQFLLREYSKSEIPSDPFKYLKQLKDEFCLDEADIEILMKEIEMESGAKLDPKYKELISEQMDYTMISDLFQSAVSICRYKIAAFDALAEYINRRIADARPSEMAVLQQMQKVLPLIKECNISMSPEMLKYVLLLQKFHEGK